MSRGLGGRWDGVRRCALRCRSDREQSRMASSPIVSPFPITQVLQIILADSRLDVQQDMVTRFVTSIIATRGIYLSLAITFSTLMGS